MRQIFIFLIFFSLFFSLWLLTCYPDKNLHLIFCDVGQGDAILLQQGFKQFLIDTGPDDQVLSCLRQFMPAWDKHLEMVLLTHDDFDHIGGLETVLNNYEIGEIIADKSIKINDLFLKINKKLGDEWLENNYKKPLFGTKIYLSGSFWGEIVSHSQVENLFFLASKIAKTETQLSDEQLENTKIEKDANDRSIVLLWHAKNKKFLFMGDLGEAGELALINKNLTTKIDLLKIGHHGSKTSTSWPFLLNTQPEIAIISCGKFNNFGHPDSAILDKLAKIGAKVFRTDELGSLEFITNGEELWMF